MKVQLLKLGQYSAAFLASATMAFSPVAMGKQAEKVSKQSITENIRYYGLNKTQTVNQFWQKIKAEVPGPLYKGLESVAKNNKNVKMPKIAVKEVVATDGSRIPSLTVDQGGKITTIQFHGEKKKWITVNGKVMTEQQVRQAIAQADKQQATAANSARIQKYRKDFARFDGFPRMTPQLWKSMTPEKRAGYITQMRMMWLDARRVVSVNASSAKAAPKRKKTAALDSVIEMFVGDYAFANPPAGGQGPFRGQCVVAGYIGTYEPDGRTCRVQNAIDSERYEPNGNLDFVRTANEHCQTTRGPSYAACNPVIYGYGRTDSMPICANKEDPNFQYATHFPGPCDMDSRLTSDDGSILNEITWGTSGDYSTANKSRAEQIQAIEANQRSSDPAFALTQNYLQTVLRHRQKIPQDATLAGILQGTEPWNKDIDDEMIRIQTQFEAEINDAIRICTSSINPGTVSSHEPRQIGACDQLHRRWLFAERIIAQYRQRGCVDGSTYMWTYGQNDSAYTASGEQTVATRNNRTNIQRQNGDTQGTPNMCRCEGGAEVAFGAECPGGETPPVTPDPEEPPAPTQCTDARYTPDSFRQSLTAECKCQDGDDPEREDGQWTCDDDGGFPWLLVGGGLLAVGLGLCLFGVICGGDDDDDPPKCRNGQPAPNGDPSQCVFCADNSPAPGGNVANCPVTCPNGTQVTPPATCPTNNCPDGSPRPPNGICPETPPPVCPGTQTPAPGGNVANCPVYCPGTQTPAPNNDASKCPVTCPGGQVVTPPATCPPVCEPGFSGNPCVCTRTCSAGFTLNPSACRCDENPPSEGGGGQPQCQNPPCSGGLPGTGN